MGVLVRACRARWAVPCGTPSPSPQVRGFCLGALGGTLVLSIPQQHVTIAVTVNMLTASRSVTLEVVRLVARYLRLGEPSLL